VLTIHSSRSRFAARLNSGVRPQMSILRLVFFLAASILLIGGCAPEKTPSPPAPQVPAKSPPPTPPPPPDEGDVGRFLKCSAKPRRALSPREQCEIAAFRARCTETDDCYVSCLSSPDGIYVGGGCSHVCTYGLHTGEPRPAQLQGCNSVPGESGLVPRSLGPNNSFKPKPLRGSA
jgi:hypothetical protein